MESIIIVLVGILTSVAIYLLLSKNLIRIILGTAILSHAVHLLILTMGGLKSGTVPLLGENAERYIDALPQALILTAIVISFAVTAFVLVLAYRVYQEYGTDRMDELRGSNDEQ
ncbi:multicomponent Na+:H+ antiporter subunit C [Chryseomicrobium aureum]|uniref:Na(+)/H(+) antiporter subunit C n=1 Tax=Chryseomicrobium aureum TaxID=1441723 RepID=UPI00195E3FFA|nr:Na(+)/H(+) antiporter subunit C [Chryseomicrobium aureum]MBM7705809.1 multicomponent Na+:H+ antiporter subunit C [Chryseomicrobium aureum]